MLKAKNIDFGYRADRLVLSDISFEVMPGERVHLSASSGEGKTTLARVLAGYERPLSGEITVDGDPLLYRGVCPVQLIGQHPELMLDPRMRMSDTLAEAAEISSELNERLGIRAAM